MKGREGKGREEEKGEGGKEGREKERKEERDRPPPIKKEFSTLSLPVTIGN